MADIFLSHSSTDHDAASMIKSWIERDRKSWSVFLSKDKKYGIIAGQNWQDRLRAELQGCRLVLAIITVDWLASHWCFAEAVTATFRGKDFIGVLPYDLSESDLKKAPPIVHERQHQKINLTTGAGWKSLIYALDRSGLDPSNWFSIPKGVGPYPGFVAFEEKDAGVFFGRDQEITEYLDALNRLKVLDRAQALVISGGSGCGKSSLLKAGLIPRLRRQPDWLVIPTFDLSRDPINKLFLELRKIAQSIKADIDLPRTNLPQTAKGLFRLLQDIFGAFEDKVNKWILLPLDQSEVLLVNSEKREDSDASRLLSAVGQVLVSRKHKLVAVLTIRTEFMPILDRVLEKVRLKERSLRTITNLSEIIEKPAERFGIELKGGLTSLLVEDTRAAHALPLLAYTLRELNEKYGDNKILTVSEYKQLGGVEGAIEKKLKEALSDPKPDVKELNAFRSLFVRHLVKVDENAVEGERYLCTSVERKILPKNAERLVNRFVDARLIVSIEKNTIALAHDRLIKNWQSVPFKTWLVEDSDDRRFINNMNALLTAYVDGGPLLTGKQLLDAKEFQKRNITLKDDEPELYRFIKDSERAERGRQRKQKLLYMGTFFAALIFLILAVAAGWFYLEAIKQTKNAELRKLEAEHEAERVIRAAYNSQLARVSDLWRQNPSLSVDLLEDTISVPAHLQDFTWELLYYLSKKKCTTLFGHENKIFSVAFSPDGKTLASGSDDRTIKLWDPQTETLSATLKGHQGKVRSVAFSPDGNFLATTGEDKTIKLWDLKSREEIATLHGSDDYITTVAFSPNGNILGSGDYKTVVLWDLPTKRKRATLVGHRDYIFSVAFSPDGKTLASASADRTIKLWDPQTETLSATLKGHQGKVRSVAFSPDGNFLATAGDDQTIKLWDLESKRELATLSGHGSWVLSVAFSSNGKTLASAGVDKTIKLWDVNTKQERATLTGHGSIVRSVAFSPKTKKLASASEDKTVKLWKPEIGQERVSLSGHRNSVFSVAISPDNRNLASASEDSTIKLWDLQTGKESKTLKGHTGWVLSVAFSPDGKTIASASADKTIKLWDQETGKLHSTFDGHHNKIFSIAFSPNGRILASASSDIIKLLDPQTMQEISTFSEHTGTVRCVAFSPDGKTLASASEDKTVKLWDLQIGQERTTLIGHSDKVLSVAYSPDGNTIASASWDKSIKLWDAKTGEERATLTGHNDWVFSVAFSPNSETLASASSDRNIKLWDAKTGQERATLSGHSGYIFSVTFSADGKTLASAGDDRVIKLWGAPSP